MVISVLAIKQGFPVDAFIPPIPCVNGFIVYIENLAPFHQGSFRIAYGYANVRTSIPSLCFHVCPPAIFGGIVPIVVYPIYGKVIIITARHRPI